MSAIDTTLNNNSTSAAVDARSGQSASQFAASLVTSVVLFAVQVVAFLLIKDRLARIYQPRTYLVPERERTNPIAPGWWKWIKPVLTTSNSEFVQKCGLDAYFFLRYLRTLLKLFVPAALVILPILLPLNATGGKGGDWALTNPGESNVTGLDQLSWSNIAPDRTNRLWAHWLLALALIIWVCYIAFDELRNYIRMRQAYMTSPQHRLRASATTVLVSSIPEKWLSVEALDGLYDVFPGGLRNIWINRNYDELSQKVSKRDELARALEAAETSLIKKCFKNHEEILRKKAKEEGKQLNKQQRKEKEAIMDQQGRQKAENGGMDSGNPHQVKHTIREALEDDGDSDTSRSETQEHDSSEEKPKLPLPSALNEGVHAVSHGLSQVGRGILEGFKGVNKGVNHTLDTTNGYISSSERRSRDHSPHPNHYVDGASETQLQSRTRTSDGTFSQRKSSVHDATPRPHVAFPERNESGVNTDNDRQPLKSPSSQQADTKKQSAEASTTWQKIKKAVGLADEPKEHVEYEKAFNEEFEGDSEQAVWKIYIQAKDRDTMRLPIFGWGWMFALPLIGKKVDTIYYCRKEVARLNIEIEDDQAHPERFPFMNSAFIQFNHQVAAHMACQTVSHHLPKQMAPRLVEIDPNDVIWDNMSIPWWQVYVRTAGVVAVVVGMIILWAIPVAFTSALSQLSVAAANYSFLNWILRLPQTLISILQGVLPPALLALLLFLLPMILRFLSTVQGMQSGMMVEMSVQKYYFFFLFVQIFLVVTIANSAVTLLGYFQRPEGVTQIPNLLGSNIPKASNYFFSYMILQALSVSAGALVQIGGLLSWFVLAPFFDTTARDKFVRQTQLSDIQWGTFFPVYTNLACIGLIYSVISPLILIFNIITFALFWFVYRYQTLYVTRFTKDTGGLLYPNAINCTFVGLYVLELGLIGLFFTALKPDGSSACLGQGIGMVVVLILTAGYQILLNEAFRPLFRYLPITLEDDAVRRDEEFARAMRIRHEEHQKLVGNEDEDQDIEDQLEAQERASIQEDQEQEAYEMEMVEQERDRARRVLEEGDYSDVYLQNPEVTLNVDHKSKGYRFMTRTAHKASDATHKTANVTLNAIPGRMVSFRQSRNTWADRNNASNRRSSHWAGIDSSQSPDGRRGRDSMMKGPDHPSINEGTKRKKSPSHDVLDRLNNFNPIAGDAKDLEAQQHARDELAKALFAGVNDELEDLSQEQRDALVQRAFQHAALRARRPVIWIPRDELGVSDDEIVRMGHFSKNIWVSNVRQGLDGKGRCVYSGAPPDFSEVEVIRL